MSIFRGFSKLTDSHDEIFVELESHERLGETPGGDGEHSRRQSPERHGSSEWSQPPLCESPAGLNGPTYAGREVLF